MNEGHVHVQYCSLMQCDGMLPIELLSGFNDYSIILE